MNKLMLVATIFACTVAQAQEVARVQNNDGGYIVFTAAKCGSAKNFYSVYGYGSSSNDTISGCFKFSDGAFWVIWQHDASIKRYPSEAVTWNQEFLDVIKKDRKTY